MINDHGSAYQIELSNIVNKILRDFTSKISTHLSLTRYSMNLENTYIHDDVIEKILVDSQSVIGVHQKTFNHKEESEDAQQYFHNLIVIDSAESVR